MIHDFSGALIRAWLTLLLMVSPALVLPGREDGAEIVLLIGFAAACLVFVEYLAVYPGLMEFSSAPPFNRIRFAMLAVTVLSMALMLRGLSDPNLLTEVVTAVGVLVGHAIDLPGSPVRLMTAAISTGDAGQVAITRAFCGIGYLTSLMSLAIFIAAARFAGWPGGSGFNVWTNLPTFEPTASADIVARLRRDARINLILGFTLPFLIPQVVTLAAPILPPLGPESPLTLIWTVAAWSFLPASLMMRGMAMGLVATMIDEARRPRARAGELAPT